MRINSSTGLGKIIFLGFAVSDKTIKELSSFDSYPSIQTHNYTKALINCLRRIYDVDVISAQPVSDYPHCKKIFFRRRNDKLIIGKTPVVVHEIPFLNYGVLKVFSRFLSSLWVCVSMFFSGGTRKYIVVYSVHLPFMFTGLILSFLYKVELVGVWTDPPSVLNKRDGKFKKYLRGLERILSVWIMAKFDKVVVIAQQLAVDFAPGKPYLVIESISNKSMSIRNSRREAGSIVLYTGSLDERYGIKNLLSAVSLIESREFELHIYGKGDYEAQVRCAAKLDHRIKYNGFISHDKILEAQVNADFLINTRSAKEEYVKYSFPSKVTEYLQSGTPLITTMLPGMPLEYRDYILEVGDNTPENIAETIIKALALSVKDRLLIGARAQEFMLTKSVGVQSARLSEFLEDE